MPLDSKRVQDDVKRIQEYVWARHVDGSDKYDHDITEDDAIRVLDEFYSQIPNRNSPDQVYLAILLFEKAFEEPDEKKTELFARARRIFEFYRRVTGETDWDAIEDRMEDIDAFLEVPEEEPEPIVEAPPPPPPEPEPEVVPPPEPAPEVEPEEPEPATATAVAEPPAEEPAPVPVEVAPVVEEDADDRARREAAEAVVAGLEVVQGMKPVPAGTFLFGPEDRELYLDTYYIDQVPVTNEEFERFVRETGYRAPRFFSDPRLNNPRQPVVGVSVRDAMQYASWAGKELPTEEQWEKAARGTDGRPFPWGNDPPGASDACYGLDAMEGAPVPVGQSLRNVSPFGIQDTCGNVWEWTKSRFERGSEYAVVKGGAYNDGIEFLRLDYRLEAHPKDKYEILGFRCVKNIH